MAWDEIKYALNSTLGTSDFTSLDKRKSLTMRFINKDVEQITLASVPSTVGTACGSVKYNSEIFICYNTDLRIYNTKTDTWRNGATIPLTVERFCFPLLVNGEIYVFYRTTALKYTIATNTWTTLATIPTSVWVDSHKPISINGEIYVCNSDGVNFLKYNIATNSWTTLASLPITNIRTRKFAELDGFMYAMYSTSVYKYDISANSWSTISSTGSTDGLYNFVYNNEIYNFSTIAKKFNPTTSVTTALASPPATVASSKPLVDEVNKKVYFTTSTAVYMYDFEKNTWTTSGGLTNFGTHIAELIDVSMFSVNATNTKKLDLGTLPTTLFLNKGNKVYIDGELVETIEIDGKYSYSVLTDVSNIGGFSKSVLQIT